LGTHLRVLKNTSSLESLEEVEAVERDSVLEDRFLVEYFSGIFFEARSKLEMEVTMMIVKSSYSK